MNYSQSLTGRLFKLVFGGYLILAIVVTAAQLTLEYLTVKETISSDLASLGNSFREGISGALWELNRPQLQTMAQGIAQSSIVTGVKITTETGEIIANSGELPSEASTKPDSVCSFSLQYQSA